MIGRKTSFEAVIESFDFDTPAHWPLKGRSLPYGRLQSCMEINPTRQMDSGSQQEQQADFVSQLRKEVHLIDRCTSSLPVIWAVRICNTNSWCKALHHQRHCAHPQLQSSEISPESLTSARGVRPQLHA